jgi:hypothetical protein
MKSMNKGGGVMTVSDNRQQPIYTYYKQRLEEVGLTSETNKREVMNDGSPQVIPVFYPDEHNDCLDIPYITPSGEMEMYMEGKKLRTFSRKRYRVPREIKNPESGEIKKIRYNQPPSTGVRSYCPPDICRKYKQKEEIRTLVVVEGEFKAIAGSVFGLDIIGIGGIHNFRIKERNEMEENIGNVIRECKVQNVILLFDADCLKVEYKGDKIDLSKRLADFHAAVMRFHELLIPFGVEFYFAHIQTKYMVTAKGLDDLLATPFIREDKEAKRQIKTEFDKLSTGTKKYISIMHITASSENKLKKYFLLDSVHEFYEANKEIIQDRAFTYKGGRYYYDGSKVQNAFYDEARQYLRVGTDFYKQIWEINPHKDPRHQKPELRLKAWKVGEINRDYNNNKAFITYIPRYDQFCNIPDNTSSYQRIIETEHEGIVSKSYNMYSKLDNEITEGEWSKTERFLRHIFQSNNTAGESLYEFGLDYIQLTYFKPIQRLPVLCLVSRERNTGKSTFINFLQLIFKENISILDNERFTGKFTSHFVYKLIVALDEGFIPIELKLIKERIKNYSTGRTVWLEGKGTNASEIYNFIHLIMCSNDETNFMQIDEGENRFAILKIPTLPFDDPLILQKMEEEIPAFLYFLSNRKLHYEENKSRFSFDTKVYETEALKAIQERTQNFLPKHVRDYIRELFMISGESFLYLTPIDIVRGINIFSQVKLSHPSVTDHLKFELNMKPEPRRRYTLYKESTVSENETGYTTVSLTGFPYKFFFEDFLSEEDIAARGNTSGEKMDPPPESVQLSFLEQGTSIKHNNGDYPF